MKRFGGGEAFTGLTPTQKTFLDGIAFPHLNGTTNADTLKHFADVWWNLCMWEKQRADVLDGKAQMLLGLAGVASSFVAVAKPIGLFTHDPKKIALLMALLALMLAAIAAVLALRVTDYGGFLDTDVFGALTITKTLPIESLFADNDPHLSYLRELSMQRWLVYSTYKAASSVKARRVQIAQYLALSGFILLVASI